MTETDYVPAPAGEDDWRQQLRCSFDMHSLLPSDPEPFFVGGAGSLPPGHEGHPVPELPPNFDPLTPTGWATTGGSSGSGGSDPVCRAEATHCVPTSQRSRDSATSLWLPAAPGLLDSAAAPGDLALVGDSLAMPSEITGAKQKQVRCCLWTLLAAAVCFVCFARCCAHSGCVPLKWADVVRSRVPGILHLLCVQ